MSLKSSNKVDTNVWELEVSVDGDTFKDAVTKAYLKQRKNITIRDLEKERLRVLLLKNITARVCSMRTLLRLYIPMR